MVNFEAERKNRMISKVKPLVSDTGEKKNWFEIWFDSPYYHILYKERDEEEAENFLDNLINKLQLKSQQRILDVACGKGRHSVYLNKKEFDVCGYDLSEQSIRHNLELENETLHFYLHDMREVFRINYFDLVLNLFSSFGYFDNAHDNYRCLQSHAAALKKGGILVLDYFNTEKIRVTKQQDYEKTVDGIIFHIHKKLIGNRIIKEIRFEDEGREYFFEEHVNLFDKTEFEKFFNRIGLTLQATCGNYALDSYNPLTSERMIFIVKK